MAQSEFTGAQAEVPIEQVDVVILGAGTAGLNARRAVEVAGKRAVVVEPGPFGTTCARVGCMPSKLLIAAAEAAHGAAEAGRFGVHADVRVDPVAVMTRLRAERDRFAGFVVRESEGRRDAGEIVVGRGVVGPDGVVEVHRDGALVARLRGQSVVIATGSRPFAPPPFRHLGDRLLDNEGLFALTRLPESVLVVGAGVIALELGQALHRLGVRVTLVGQGGRVGPLADPALRAEAAQIFADELDLHADYALDSVDVVETAAGEAVEVRFRGADGAAYVGRYERVLCAAGRRAVLAGLGLEHLGVAVGPRGEVEFDPETMQIGATNVFLAGDAAGDRPLLHEASDEGRIAGANAARFPAVAPVQRRVPLAIVFTDPQLASVGDAWTAHDCTRHRMGEVDFGDQGRARVMGVNRGRARIWAEAATGRLTGAELIGPRAEHLAHLLAWAIGAEMTVEQALTMPFYHPVLEEGLRTALRDLQASLRRPRADGDPCDAFAPGG